jgi:hypothetical protein
VSVGMDMNERKRRKPAPEAAGNASTGIRRRPSGFLRPDLLRLGRSGGLSWVLMAAGLASGALMIWAEVSTVSYITVLTADCEDLAGPRDADNCLQIGHERHGYAFLLLGIFAILMAWGAIVGRSRPAALALIVAGIVVIAVGFVPDYREGGKTGGIGRTYENAHAHRGKGVWLEGGGAALAIAVGAASFALRRPEPEPD